MASRVDAALDQYGGLLGRKEKATGFFYPRKIGGRWWLVDPEGGLFLNKAIVAVSQMNGPLARDAFKKNYGNDSNWVAGATGLLHAYGFNGLGAWSDTERLRQAAQPLVYTRIWDFMSSYGKKRGGTYQQSGHMGYPKDCIFCSFDPQFETFCDSYARQLAGTKDDPWLFGAFFGQRNAFQSR